MKLHDYQVYAKNWILDHPYCGLLLDMGLGKTLTTLTALEDLRLLGELTGKVLVVAPLKVARDTWSTEIEKWYPHMTYSKILGSVSQRTAALAVEADVYIINRENVVWLVEYFKSKWPFRVVVLDELSSFKSSKAKRFRALRKIRGKMDRVIGLTGTPAPNSLIDLWPQIYLLDQGARLGSSKTRFVNRYFVPAQSSGHVVYSYDLRPGSEDAIHEAVSDICVSMKAKDYLNLPGRVDNIVKVTIDDMDQYRRFERDYVLPVEGEEITASNAAVLANKLLQLANGAIYDEDKVVHHLHDDKLDALARIVEDSQGQPILVFYQFKHDLARLKSRFPQAEEIDDLDRWNRGEIPILLCHPQSAGHGLNLQKGGHIIVWFGLTWSLEYYQQANARLDRQGQTETVIIHHLVAQGTVDERVMAVLAGKEEKQEALLKALGVSE